MTGRVPEVGHEVVCDIGPSWEIVEVARRLDLLPGWSNRFWLVLAERCAQYVPEWKKDVPAAGPEWLIMRDRFPEREASYWTGNQGLVNARTNDRLVVGADGVLREIPGDGSPARLP